MNTCGIECRKYPCCDFCSSASHDIFEQNGKQIVGGPNGCKLHPDDDHQETAIFCRYCDDFTCFKVNEEKIAETSTGLDINKKDFALIPSVKTEALRISTNNYNSISEFIEMLQVAKERWGDLPIAVSDESGFTSKFDCIFLYTDESGNRAIGILP